MKLRYQNQFINELRYQQKQHIFNYFVRDGVRESEFLIIDLYINYVTP